MSKHDDPPVRACSTPADLVVQITPEEVGVVVTTPCQDTLSDENRRRRRVFFGGPDGVFEDCSVKANGRPNQS